MSAISREEVAHLANLSRISLSDGELDRLGAELPAILDHVAVVQEVVAQREVDAPITPMSHPIQISNVVRPDVVVPGLSPTEALAGAPESQDQRFVVPKILGEE